MPAASFGSLSPVLVITWRMFVSLSLNILIRDHHKKENIYLLLSVAGRGACLFVCCSVVDFLTSEEIFSIQAVKIILSSIKSI